MSKKENEKLQKINLDDTKSVSGGYLARVPGTKGSGKEQFRVFNNITGEKLPGKYTLDDALILDRQLNAHDLIEQKASEIEKTGRYGTLPKKSGLKKK